MSTAADEIGKNGPYKYGRYWPGASELDVELICFREDLSPEAGGLGRKEHFWNIVALLWGPESPKPFVRHPWADTMSEYASKHRFLSVSGCGSSGKTDFFAVWAIVNWLCDPTGTLVLVTSTTLKESRKRIWGAVVDYFQALPDAVRVIGKLVDSYGQIKLAESTGIKSSDRCGIALIPGERKREKEAVKNFIGLKNRRVILVADELPELSPAIMHAVKTNLTHNDYVQAIGMGNPASYWDAHGVFSTPKKGWKSITPADFEWETLWGWAIRFDAELSPNIVMGNDRLYPFLPTSHRLEEAKRDLGEGTFGFWRMWKGFWCPEGAESTVYSETEIFYYNAHDTEVKWVRPPIPISGLDAGYTSGGDRSIAFFALFGEEAGTGKSVLLFTEYLLVKDDPLEKVLPRSHQIIRNWRKECEKRNVLPQNAGVDATGAAAFADLVATEWSPLVSRVHFGGKSSAKTVGEDKVPANTRYGNRVTELWFTFREYMQGHQIRGLSDPDYCRELTSRKYAQSKQGDTLVVTVETKILMKSRTGQSPDIADAGFVVMAVAQTKHKFKPDSVRKKRPMAPSGNSVPGWPGYFPGGSTQTSVGVKSGTPVTARRLRMEGRPRMGTGIPRLRR